jgi:REP element-mobilizing transposase RayT
MICQHPPDGTAGAFPASMTAPRRVLPGTVYLVTRRCAQRQFLLRPSPETSAIFLYVLALAARRYGILVHAFCVLSNHFHLVVTDPYARLPAFEQYLDSLVARAMNALLGRWEAFWAPSSYSAVALVGREDVVAKIAYVLANPVAAGLVRHGRDWPGLWSAPEHIGSTTLIARRPDAFFRARGGLPESIELELALPPGFAAAERLHHDVAQALDHLERQAARDLVASGKGFAGVARVLAQRPTAAPPPREPRRTLNPRVAARDRRVRRETLSELVEFWRHYRAAWAARAAGILGVVFPAGTYLLRVMHGVPCLAPS